MTDIRPLMMVPRYWPATGGAELHSRRLAQEIARDLPVSVLRFSSGDDRPTDTSYAYAKTGIETDGTIPLHYLGARGLTRPVLQALAPAAGRFAPARRLFNMTARMSLNAQLPGLVASNNIVHGIYNGFTPAFEALEDTGLPFVFTPLAHTTKPEGTAWSSSGFRRLYDRADALIAMTEYEKDWLGQLGVRRDKIHVCPMAPLFDLSEPEPDALRRALGIDDSPMILFLGRLTPYKGFHHLLEAAEQVWRTHPDARFVFAGPGSAPTTATDPRILFTGPLSDDQKKSALQACTMLCVPSVEESLGVVYLEAWSFSKPVIAADIPVMKSVIEHGRDGWLVAPRADALAHQISALLDNPAEAREAGRFGAAKVERQYNWAETASRLKSIYAALV